MTHFGMAIRIATDFIGRQVKGSPRPGTRDINITYFDIADFILQGKSLPDNLNDVLHFDDFRSAQKYSTPEGRIVSLLSRYIQRTFISAILNIEPRRLFIDRNPFGKPFIRNADSQWLKFNVSHSGHYIVLVTSGAEVGVDIEKHRAIPDSLALVRRFFSKEEYNWLVARHDDVSFFELWTRREAFQKSLGQGLSYFAKSTAVVGTSLILDKWRIETIGFPVGYSTAVCWRYGEL